MNEILKKCRLYLLSEDEKQNSLEFSRDEVVLINSAVHRINPEKPVEDPDMPGDLYCPRCRTKIVNVLNKRPDYCCGCGQRICWKD